MKNTQKHTQGPWHATNHHVQSLVHEYDGYICKAEGNTKAEAEANARLIAAAPDLLAALKTGVALLVGHGKPVDQAMLEAIAKAEAAQ